MHELPREENHARLQSVQDAHGAAQKGQRAAGVWLEKSHLDDLATVTAGFVELDAATHLQYAQEVEKIAHVLVLVGAVLQRSVRASAHPGSPGCGMPRWYGLGSGAANRQ